MSKKIKNILRPLSEARIHDKDTGSTLVQITLLGHKINHLSQHLKKNPKDIVTRRNLLKKVAAKKRLEVYAKNNKISFPEIPKV